MALLDQIGGCKVGWEIYSTEAEALAASERESAARERKFAQGYDFGYLAGSHEAPARPPRVRRVLDRRDDLTREGGRSGPRGRGRSAGGRED